MRLILLVFISSLALGGFLYSQSTFHQLITRSGTGIVAKQLCSLTFVSNLDTDRAKELYLNDLIKDYDWLLEWEVDNKNQQVSANFFGGIYKQTAHYREGFGCTLLRQGSSYNPNLKIKLADNIPLIESTGSNAFDMPALNNAFTLETANTHNQNTLALGVMYKGELIKQWYSEKDGVSMNTRLPGWSMSKSVTATLAGALVNDNKVDIHAEGAVNDLINNNRTDITLDQLLRMTAGLALEERNDGADPTSEMLFHNADMAQFASVQERIAAPGEYWEYMSGSTNLAMRALQDRLGNTTEEQISKFRELIFDPLHASTAIIEPDASGTMVGSSYMYATLQDWLKMGQIYLDLGKTSNGETLFSPQWFEYVIKPTPGSNNRYGSGFWLSSYHKSLPNGVFLMSGFQGQKVYIWPEKDLIVVRLGARWDPSVRQFFLNVAAALKD